MIWRKKGRYCNKKRQAGIENLTFFEFAKKVSEYPRAPRKTRRLCGLRGARAKRVESISLKVKKKALKNAYVIPNLKRAFEVLECVAKNPRGVSFMQLLERLKISKTTLFRILETLESSGYLTTSVEGGLYTLSRKIMTLAYSALEEPNIAAESFDVMRRLRDEAGETVMLGALMEDSCIMVEQEAGPHDFNFTGKLGMKSPLHASAPGKALLAHLPPDALEGALKKISFVRHTERTISNRADLEKELAAIRRRGFATDDGEAVEGLRCAAAAIFNSKGYPAAVLWITGPSRRVSKADLPRLGAMVVRAAREISAKLGHE